MTLHRVLATLPCLLLVAACSSSSSSSSPVQDSSTSDVVDTGALSDGDGGGHCCTADPHPGCCMRYGGWTSSPDEDAPACGQACDGMPEPGDPAWHLVKDDHGCDVWSSAGSTGPKCGAAVDSGFDAGDTSDATDASDAPACPTSTPTRLSSCSSLDQVCFYPCGVVMRCTSSGWDYDTTIDGGPPCP